ncbi:MAG: sodium/proline symporter PutP [Lachnospiraceae bacterium]|nr:sodium/proline symporter PutP [Lachnospiraceae bacterium]
MTQTVIIIIVFLAYLFIMIGIGIYFFRRNRSVSDYILGGRKLNPWVAAMSTQASDMSGWLLLGLPGTAYLLYTGTSEAIWTAIGLFIGTWLNWLIVAKRLRKYTILCGNSLTLPDFFSNRFEDHSGILRGISALFILIFFLFYTASMFSAGAKLFVTVFDIPYRTALIIGGLIIVSYTFLGGFLAVCWTDTIQGLLMFAALIITPIVAYFKLGGGNGLADAASQIKGTFSFLPMADGKVNVMLLISSLAWGFGYFGQPHILPRFMAIRSEKEIRPARVIAMIWVLITLAMAVVVGIFGAYLYPSLADPESVFMVMVTDLFPPVITGILLTAILAAIMSTADSQLLVASSAVSSDIYSGLINKHASQKKLLWISRLTVIAISIIAILLVSDPNPKEGTVMYLINSSVFKLVAFAWAGFGSAFGPIILFSLFWKRTTKPAALAGILSGGISAFVWWLNSGGIFDIYEIVPGFLISSLVIILVSLFTKPNPSFLTTFSEMKKTHI